jgi:response regulator RpfG family c-di-GMP phosphodiesterase
VYRNGLTDFRGHRTFDDLEDRLVQLGLGLLLHDLTENADGKEHPLTAGRLLGDPYFLPLVRATVRQHHERWDGQGTPSGFSGTAIHIFARICAIVDRFDCLRRGRELAPPASRAEALVAVGAQAGSFFDPQLTDAFVSYMECHPSLDYLAKPGGYGELLIELAGVSV